MAKRKKKVRVEKENVEEKELKGWTDQPKSGFNTPFAALDMVIKEKVQPPSKSLIIRKRT